MKTKKLLFILNPRAGRNKPHGPLFDALAILSGAGYLIRIHETSAPGDAADTAAREGAGYDLVVAAGGDGTLNEVISGLMRLDAPPPLGYLPQGTTNDFASSLQIPRTPASAAKNIVQNRMRELDIGRWNERSFIYVASFGAFTRSSYAASQAAKNALGHFAYILEGMNAFYEDHYSTGENACISDITISDYERFLLRRARALGKKIVGVFFYGRPIAMQGIAEQFDAILYAWHGGCEAANAAADLLFGDRSPSGRTPVTFPRLATHLPLYYNCYSSGHEVNSYYGESMPGGYRDSLASPYYPFGFGLSYTEFEYSDIHAENKDGSIEVSLKIKNIGSFDGKTVVQVYAGANGDHPVKLLKGFKKVNVPAGKEIEETVTVYKDDLKFYDEKAGEWYLENEYTFYVGQDSADAMNNKLTVSV